MYFVRLILGIGSLLYCVNNVTNEPGTFMAFGIFWWSIFSRQFRNHSDEDMATYVSDPPLQGFILLAVHLVVALAFWENIFLGVIVLIMAILTSLMTDRFSNLKMR